ncbi:MAG: hypothetical protein C0626_05405 [Arcobacter sp.]|uniref:hypothetical protein n=1 Tax=uncultured Arcobacter sp. TaxID=165434 RepID=UPI000CB37DE1|nr:hypothetical protein [uncultured Arcobacter sp.]PLY10416.1 MAG: hypothetical protein C0626_05405 [Arcobacter sp.]
MKLRFSFFYLTIISVLKLFSTEVIIAKIDIPYNIALSPSNVAILQLDNIPKDCKPITIAELKKEKYFTKKYLQKEKIICHDDLKKENNNKVIFSFGSIEIETNGKILYENDDYIKIKRDNGKIEKIYKDGRAR